MRREEVLVGMERENRQAGLRYFADARIPVGEGIREGAAKRVDRVVQRQVSRDLAAVYQAFGTTADARAQGADQDFSGARPRYLHFPDVHPARRRMKQCAGGRSRVRNSGFGHARVSLLR